MSEATAAIIWKVAISRIRKLSEASYRQWFKNIVPVEVHDQIITLGVGDDFCIDMLKSSYSDLLSAILTDIGDIDYAYELVSGYYPTEEPEDITVSFTEPLPVVEAPSASVASVTSPPPAPPASCTTTARPAVAPALANCSSQLSFANFVVGEENRYACSAAQLCAREPGRFYNPLYIYGGCGTGKTHLLQAVVHEIKAHAPHLEVRYATCEEILNEYVAALSSGQTSIAFRTRLRNVDVLLVDDVHQLSNKKALQEEFFNTFNTLRNQSKQIILTSDRPPNEITGLEERLISRFESGVTTEITPPELETRLAILNQTQQKQLIKLDSDVLEFVAENISSNVRRLLSALYQLVSYASLMHVNVNKQLAEEILSKIIDDERSNKVISIDTVMHAVAQYFDLPLPELLGNKRPRNIAEPRMVAMYLSRELTKASFPAIGEVFGKNHATVINAMKKVPELCERDESIRIALERIERQLKRG